MIRLFACLAALSFVTGPALAQAGERDRIVVLREAQQNAPHGIHQRIERLQKEILALRALIHGGDVDLFIANDRRGPHAPHRLRLAAPGKHGKHGQRGHAGHHAPFPPRFEIEIEFEMKDGKPHVEVEVEFGDDEDEGEHKRGHRKAAVARKRIVAPRAHIKRTVVAGRVPLAKSVLVQPGGITVLRQPPKAVGGIDASARRVLELAAKLKLEQRKARGLLDSGQYAKASLSANHAAKLAKMLEEAKKKAHKSGVYSYTAKSSGLGELEKRIDRIEKLLKKLLAKNSQ